MKKILNRFLNTVDKLFAFLFIVGLTLAIISIIYTFIDLYKNTYLNVSTKESIETFLKAFNWCKPILNNTFIMFSAFYALRTFKITQENKLFNNYIIPKEKNIIQNLNDIKNQNKILYKFCINNSREIISNILSKVDNNRITNKNELTCYFDKYIKNHIDKIECSGYYGDNCKDDCTTCNLEQDIKPNTDSFRHFNLISFDLLCVSFEYIDYEKDIKDIYINSKNSFKQSRKD